jgi:hypothetical protein
MLPKRIEGFLNADDVVVAETSAADAAQTSWQRADIGFDPEFPVTFDDRARTRPLTTITT